jgi:hypothetical protein
MSVIRAKQLDALVPPVNTDVAALLRARTKDLNGTELGAFTDDTRPTGTEVDRLIQMAYAEVTGLSGIYLYAPCDGLAQSLVAIRAAMWIELSYFPEQVRSDRSAYRELADQWTALLPGLITCVEGNLPGSSGSGDPASNVGFRYGVLDVHGWTASPFYGAPDNPIS